MQKVTYDFSSSLNRKKTGSLKWQRYEEQDVLPFWVADMDFVSPPEVIHALQQRLEHGVFGYTIPYEEVQSEVIAYMQRRHGVEIEADWLVWLPGLVQGLNLMCRAAGESGDGVMVNTPVYPPFLSAPVQSDRERQTVPLHWDGSKYTFDFDLMETLVTERTRLFILCNPHNPVGRVFSKEELEQLLDFCEKHDLWLCSDEIHCDLIMDGPDHVPTLTLGERAMERTVTFLSASKTYNVPGLACAWAVIPNPKIRAAFQKVCRGIITEVNCFGYAACTTALRKGEPWRQELIKVLTQNRDRLYSYVAENHPEIDMKPMQATYLAWMDMRELGLSHPMQHFEQHGIGLSNGVDFGAETGYLRFNFGCPPAMLEEGLKRLSAGIRAAKEQRA